MRTCRHCGQKNRDEAPLCTECGLDLDPSPFDQAAARTCERSARFFRWRLAAILLWLVGVLCGVVGVLDMWIGTLASRGRLPEASLADSAKLAHQWFFGAAENTVVGALCIAGWFLMRRRTSIGLTTGACVVASGLLILMRRWILLQIAGLTRWSWVDALVWSFLLYAIIYALRELKTPPKT